MVISKVFSLFSYKTDDLNIVLSKVGKNLQECVQKLENTKLFLRHRLIERLETQTNNNVIETTAKVVLDRT